MHSAHHSRGRIVFEVFCALALAGSLAGAWAQTDASALLSAAAVAALYGVWHLTDLRRPRPSRSSAPALPADDGQGDLLAYAPAAPALSEPAESPVGEGAKPSRKAPKPRKSRAKEAQPSIAEITDRLEREIGKVAEEPAAPDPEPQPGLAPDVVDSADDTPEYIPATPLFEPEPFVRQQRAAFGRKARP